MKKELIDKIKKYSIISFAVPLIAINACLFVYKLLGSIELHPTNLDWDKDIVEYSYTEHKEIISGFSALTDPDQIITNDNYDLVSFTNCPKYEYNIEYTTNDNKILIDANNQSENKIKKIKYVFNNKINNTCIKKYKFSNYILSNINFIEKVLIFAKVNNKSGFTNIKSPYLYGEVSISRTARYYPATFIFKPLVILSAIFLILYWRSNLNLFQELKDKNILTNFSKKFFYFGILSCIFLILHASFLGLDFDSKLFQKARRLIIILFIVFEVIAQILLTRNLYKLKNEIKNYINSTVLKIKISFVLIVLLLTSVIFVLLAADQLDTSSKHMLEWNYFSFLLIFYFLSRVLWKSK